MSEHSKTIVKVCKVHGELTPDQAYLNGKYYRCRECSKKWPSNFSPKRKASLAEWKARNREKCNLSAAASYHKNKHKHKIRVKKNSEKWKKNNNEKDLLQKRIGGRKRVKELSDVYLKNIMSRNTILSHADVPNDLVDLKRKNIIIKRELKNI